MKKNIFFNLIIIVFLCVSCEYDNYDEPAIALSGKLTYKGENFLYDGNPDRGLLKIYQEGFGKEDGGTPLGFNENGEYQQLLFADNYYRITPDNRSFPFEFDDFKPRAVGYDSITVNITRNTEMNFEVTPYYTFSNYVVSLRGTDIVMNFDVSKVNGTDTAAPRIVRARCYVSTSTLVNSKTICVIAKDVSITDQGHIELVMPVATYRSTYVNNFREYAFCRVAIELENIPDYYLFSETKKIEGLPD